MAPQDAVERELVRGIGGLVWRRLCGLRSQGRWEVRNLRQCLKAAGRVGAAGRAPIAGELLATEVLHLFGPGLTLLEPLERFTRRLERLLRVWLWKGAGTSGQHADFKFFARRGGEANLVGEPAEVLSNPLVWRKRVLQAFEEEPLGVKEVEDWEAWGKPRVPRSFQGLLRPAWASGKGPRDGESNQPPRPEAENFDEEFGKHLGRFQQAFGYSEEPGVGSQEPGLGAGPSEIQNRKSKTPNPAMLGRVWKVAEAAWERQCAFGWQADLEAAKLRVVLEGAMEGSGESEGSGEWGVGSRESESQIPNPKSKIPHKDPRRLAEQLLAIFSGERRFFRTLEDRHQQLKGAFHALLSTLYPGGKWDAFKPKPRPEPSLLELFLKADAAALKRARKVLEEEGWRGGKPEG